MFWNWGDAWEDDEVMRIIDGKQPEQKLMWLEIKAGNRCNLACRICFGIDCRGFGILRHFGR